jgi:hypothetical protein
MATVVIGILWHFTNVRIEKLPTASHFVITFHYHQGLSPYSAALEYSVIHLKNDSH